MKSMSMFFAKAKDSWRHIALLGFLFLIMFGVTFSVAIFGKVKSPGNSGTVKAAMNGVGANIIAMNPLNPAANVTSPSNVSYLNYEEWAGRFGLSGANLEKNADPDGDGLQNIQEFSHLTSPMNADTDGDGFRDLQEILNGYDPDASGDARPAVKIIVKKINVDAPVIWSASEEENELKKDLEKGVIHFPGSAAAGQIGNMVVSGHSSNYVWAEGDFNHVFEDLGKLENGDTATIKTIQRNGRVILYDYKVKEKFVVSPDDARIFEQSQDGTLTLSTCWPLGTAFRRLIVKAELVR